MARGTPRGLSRLFSTTWPTATETTMPAGPPSRRQSIFTFAVLTLLSTVLALFAVVIPNLHGLLMRAGLPPSWIGTDLDTGLIHAGLLRAPGFAQTLRWWTGPWVAGSYVPFYRPLSSCVFWLEWKVLGDREDLYLVPAIAAHVVGSSLFAFLAYRLAVLYRLARPLLAGCAAAWCFAGTPCPIVTRQAVAATAALLWKNQPDTLAAACCLLALLAYLRAQAGSRRALAAAAAAYLAGCCFKEIAIPLPLVCLALESAPFPQCDRTGARRRIAAMALAAVAFLTIRYLAIRVPGYTYGGNGAWIRRTIQELLGPFYPLACGDWLAGSVAIWLYAVGRVFRRSVAAGPGDASAAGADARPVAAGITSESAKEASVPRLRSADSAAAGRGGPAPRTGGCRGLAPRARRWARHNTPVNAHLSLAPRARRWALPVAFCVALAGTCLLGVASLPKLAGEAPIGGPALLATGILVTVQPVNLVTTLNALALLTGVSLLWRADRRLLLLPAVWTAALLAPLAASAGPLHRYYLPQGGFALLYALALASWGAVQNRKSKMVRNGPPEGNLGREPNRGAWPSHTSNCARWRRGGSSSRGWRQPDRFGGRPSASLAGPRSRRTRDCGWSRATGSIPSGCASPSTCFSWTRTACFCGCTGTCGHGGSAGRFGARAPLSKCLPER